MGFGCLAARRQVHPTTYPVMGLAALMLSTVSAQANIAISTAVTQNMNCSGGVCTATAASAVLNVTDLQNLLASGNTTVATGSLAASIVIQAPFGWASSNSLTLDAKRSVTVNKAVTDNGAGGADHRYERRWFRRYIFVRHRWELSCCRFDGHRVKVGTMNRRSGNGPEEVYTRVQG